MMSDTRVVRIYWAGWSRGNFGINLWKRGRSSEETGCSSWVIYSCQRLVKTCRSTEPRAEL
jgi:hypothetical protein